MLVKLLYEVSRMIRRSSRAIICRSTHSTLELQVILLEKASSTTKVGIAGILVETATNKVGIETNDMSR